MSKPEHPSQQLRQPQQSPPPPEDKPLPVPPRGHARHQDALIDAAVEESMAASDPISPYTRESAEPVAADDGRRAKDPADKERADRAPDTGSKEENPTSRWNGWTRGPR